MDDLLKRWVISSFFPCSSKTFVSTFYHMKAVSWPSPGCKHWDVWAMPVTFLHLTLHWSSKPTKLWWKRKWKLSWLIYLSDSQPASQTLAQGFLHFVIADNSVRLLIRQIFKFMSSSQHWYTRLNRPHDVCAKPATSIFATSQTAALGSFRSRNVTADIMIVDSWQLIADVANIAHLLRSEQIDSIRH